MRFSKDLKIKSVVLKLEELEGLIDAILNLTKDDNKDFKWQQPEFKLETFQGETFSFDAKKGFIDCVKSNLKNIKELDLSYYGDDMRFGFYFNNWKFSTNLSVTIAANDRSKMLLFHEEVERFLSRNSWNFVADRLITLAFIVFFVGIFVVYREALGLIDKDLFMSVFYLILLMAGLLNISFLSSCYPTFVIEYEGERSGRVFRKDLWIVVIAVVLPFVINVISNFL